MKRGVAFAVLVVAVVTAACATGCGSAPPRVRLTEDWPSHIESYGRVVAAWTRTATLRAQYQEVASVAATFKSPDWRAAHAQRDADHRQLAGEARDELLAQAQAEMAGPYEVEILLTTWDRRENDLDHGKHSVWHVVLVDDQGREVAPLEIVRDKRPDYVLRAEFPLYGDFSLAYIAKFPRSVPLLGPNVKQVRLRMSSERGGMQMQWQAR